MATLKINNPEWATADNNAVSAGATKSNQTTWEKIIAFADSQAPNRTGWFMFALLLQGVLFLPVPAFLLYYFSAPIIVLAITLVLFFANIIAGMGGSGIRTLLGLFAFSILVHITMLLVFIL
ncbi:hypothetical protein LX99_00554 [Mucilaginibacter oryzae]|uniref:Uncharacterized protein n=1 Tax=Mucilaginibacter oryzae TaxID=468058 RepID=A0A316HJ70_9SPHI|nr:hypothetical protein [Mucilaginibacter oryzae]PWK80090.1 hypothetical protein LX99_00554 [Mucilaginibacter oryzae]